MLKFKTRLYLGYALRILLHLCKYYLIVIVYNKASKAYIHIVLDLMTGKFANYATSYYNSYFIIR